MAAPGWYPDPLDPTAAWLRLWDGETWTDQRRAAPETAVTGPLPVTSSGPGRSVPLTHVVMALIAAVGLVVVVIAVARSGGGQPISSGLATETTLGVRPGAPGVPDGTIAAPLATLAVTTTTAPAVTAVAPPQVTAATPTSVPPPTTPPTSSPPASAPTTSSTTVPSTTTTSVSPRVEVLRQQGNGSTTTQAFRVRNNEWLLAWSFNCSAGAVNGISLAVRGVGTTFDDITTRPDASGSGNTWEHPAGWFYLVISTSCDWTVTVTG